MAIHSYRFEYIEGRDSGVCAGYAFGPCEWMAAQRLFPDAIAVGVRPSGAVVVVWRTGRSAVVAATGVR